MKRSFTKFFLFTVTIFATLACVHLQQSTAGPYQQQMEIRKSEEFNEKVFQNSQPAVGTQAPDVELKTLEGETVKLSSYRDKNIVVIKAGYT